MSATLTLLDLAGSVALLLWGTRMVQTGIQRAFGAGLRRVLAAALGNRVRAFLAGIGATAALQSSTAAGLIVASFAANGLVELVPALAIMLGANVGSTLIVQVLSFDVSRCAPVLILAGVVMFRRGGVSRTHDLGRVAIGLGLMLMALRAVLDLLTPDAKEPSLRLLLGALAADPVVDVLLGAVLTWAAHSSVAIVLLIASFTAQGVLPPQAAFALVLGANLGTAVNPVLEGASGEDAAARRVALGNLLTRLIGCAVVLPLLGPISRLFVEFHPGAARDIADFHTAFNLALALAFLPLLGPYAAVLRRLVPAQVAAADPGRPMYLDAAAGEVPALAIAAAAREALRMADILSAMLEGAQEALASGDRTRIAETRRLDDVLDRLNRAIKSYLSALDVDALGDRDRQGITRIVGFTVNLEHAGDVVERNLLAHASKCVKRGLALTPADSEEIAGLMQRLNANLRAAVAVFMTEDARAARELAAQKAVMRDIEAAAMRNHFARLGPSPGRGSAISGIHLDIVRDLKRINDHLVAAAAYPVLEQQGELLPTRLRESGDPEAG